MTRSRFTALQWTLTGLLWITLMISPHLFSSEFSSEPTSSNEHFSTSLSGLLNYFRIPHQHNFDSMVQATQKWRRKPDQERWEMPEIKLDKAGHDKVMSYLKQLGLINELSPGPASFEYALVLGATVPRMERRFNHLANLWKKGVRFQSIIFLVGQRPLTDGVDKVDTMVARAIGKQASSDRVKAARPQTETEGAKLVYETIELPPAMRQLRVEFIDTPRTWQQDHWQRANTRDTLKMWLKSRPAPGKALVMSDQPHAYYQAEVVRQELPKDFQVNIAAQEADPETRLNIYLDALALWLHNLQLRTSDAPYK